MHTAESQELMESVVIDPTPLMHADEAHAPFDIPFWILVLGVLLFALASVGAVRARHSTEDTDEEKQRMHTS